MASHRKRDSESDDAQEPNPHARTTPTLKRQKTFPKEQYTLAWVCALPLEMSAAIAMLDDVHLEKRRHTTDTNAYVLGSIGHHNVVILCLPVEQYGTVKAAQAITHAIRTFPSIELALMVGIGGGIPSPSNDIRLGDIVVGTRVMAYDLSKVVPGGLTRTDAVQHLKPQAGALVSALRARHDVDGEVNFHAILQEQLEKHREFRRPELPDQLFYPGCRHDASSERPMIARDQLSTTHGNPVSLDCSGCDPSQIVSRVFRDSKEPKLHYGAIASGNHLMKDGISRDRYARELDVICFDMESAGLIDSVPCIPIRGICDYSDTHKNKHWQKYAALAAASFAKEMAEHIPLHDIVEVPSHHGEGDSNGGISSSNVASSDDRTQLERRRQLLDSLKFDQIDTRKISITPAHAKTCQWLLQLPEYQQWVDHQQANNHRGFLWLRGKPGVGKSTIMKFIYGRMKKKDRRNNILTVSFFFHARGEPLEKSISGMYRSLLYQILQEFPDLQHLFENPDIVPRTQSGSLSLDVLKSLLQATVLRLGQRSLTCYVDALDECDEQQIMDMVCFFEDLAQTAIEDKVRLRICFSSRHYPYINVRFGLRLTLEDMAGHADDLAQYIQSTLRVDDSLLPGELQEHLLKKSAGVFLWVKLVVDILNNENRRGGFALHKKLSQVPKGLNELFRGLAKRDSNDMDHFRLCILWILCAERPLTPMEHYHAIWAGLAMKNLADNQPPESKAKHFEDNARISVVSTSKGLAEVIRVTDGGKDTVQFIHESVRDFLIKDRGLYDLWPDLGLDWESSGHELLKSCCKFYFAYHVSIREDNLPKVLGRNALITPARDLPLRAYASHNMLYHANGAAKAYPQQGFLASFDFRQWVAIYNAHEDTLLRRFHPDTNLVYVLAVRGYAQLLRLWSAENPDFKALEPIYLPGHEYKHPLFAALASGSKETVAALLRSNSTVFYGCDMAEVSIKTTELREISNKRAPMTWAVEQGLTGFVQWMLESGVDPDAPDRDELPAVHYACVHNREGVLRLFMSHGVDLEYEHLLVDALERGQVEFAKHILEHQANSTLAKRSRAQALKYTVWCGDLQIARLLLEHEISRYDISRCLVLATEAEHASVVELLIHHQADVNHQDNSGQTALFRAAIHRSTTIIELLIHHQAHVNHQDHYGQTALFEAAAHWRITTMELLIHCQANVNHQDNNGQTALFRAVNAEHASGIELLIHHQAYINHQDKNGQTALFKTQSTTIMELLIHYQASVNHIDSFGYTAAFLSAAHGHIAVMELLVHHLADINHTDKFGQTVLTWAAEGGHASMAELLVQNQASVNCKSIKGYTPLTVASREGHTDVAKVLIQHGADVNSLDDYHMTALIWSACCGNSRKLARKMAVKAYMDIAKILFEKGADINAQDHQGWTPLMHAAKIGEASMVGFLLQIGANKHITSNAGLVALNLASQSGHQEAAAMLADNAQFSS